MRYLENIMHFYELLEKYLVNKNSFYCGSLVYDKSNHFPGGSDGKASAYNAGDSGSIPGSERSAGEGNGNPLQRSCLENPTDRGACQATVRGVTKSRTRLSKFLSLSLNPRLHLPLFCRSASPGWESTNTTLKPKQIPTLFFSGHS